MIDIDTAKQLITEQWLPACEEDLETPAMLLEDKTEEFEWGWTFYWQPVDPSQVPKDRAKWGYLPILVDRTNGNVCPVGTAGLKVAILHLLSGRDSA
jgi:hypothetical protein